MVTVNVPVGVLPEVVTLMVDEPDPVTLAGLKVAFAFEGKPLALKLTTPLKPLSALTLTL